MKMQMSQKLAYNIHKGLKNGSFYWASNGIYIIFTYDKFVMYKVHYSADMFEYFSKIKQPPAAYESLRHVFDYSSYGLKILNQLFTFDDFIEYKKWICLDIDGHKYLYDKKLLTPFKAKKYQYNLAIGENVHLLLINEFDKFETYDSYGDEDVVAIVMGCREV